MASTCNVIRNISFILNTNIWVVCTNGVYLGKVRIWIYSENKWKTKDNLCAHVYKLNATLKLRIDIDQKDSNSNFAAYL